MLESSSGVKEMREEIAVIAGEYTFECTRESWLNRVPPQVKYAKRNGGIIKNITFRMVKEIWYYGANDPDHPAVQAIKRKAAEVRARQEAVAAAAQFRTIAAGLHAIDPEMHSDSITQYLDMAREISRQVGE